MLIAALLPASCAMFYAFIGSMCKNEILAEIHSPEKAFKTVVFQSD